MTLVEFAATVAATTAVLAAAQSARTHLRVRRERARAARLLATPRPRSRVEVEAAWCSHGDHCPTHPEPQESAQ